MKMKNFSEQFSNLKNSYRIAYLLNSFIQKNLSIDEQKELDKWILRSEDNMQLFEDLTDEKNIQGFLAWYAGRDVEKKLQETKKRLRFGRASKILSFWKYAAAACILAVVGFSIYHFVPRLRAKPETKLSIHEADIEPGSEYAALKMSNGKIVALNNNKDTVINSQIKVVNGELVYDGEAEDEEPGMEELDVPRKGFYKLVLPDGSRVWLNSESSIRYPNVFSGSERDVEVTGETYFEVAKDATRPFVVSVNGIKVQALGTEFNINAYSNENDFRATLIHGMIRVSWKGREEILKPDEQVRIEKDNWNKSGDVELASIVAWKDNQFKFKNTPIEQIMRDVERWYDADVVFQDRLNLHLNGTIGRNVPVSKLLRVLGETEEFHFKIDGRKITIMK